jgi:hypothetical protein
MGFLCPIEQAKLFREPQVLFKEPVTKMTTISCDTQIFYPNFSSRYPNIKVLAGRKIVRGPYKNLSNPPLNPSS